MTSTNCSTRWPPNASTKPREAKGGIFLYPGDVQPSGPPKGKLRLMYEGNPMALIVEQAGGLGTDASRRILDIQASDVHHRTPLVIDSKESVEESLSLYK